MSIEMLAKNVKRLRVESGFTQKDLANNAGVSLPTIKKLEGAKGETRVNTLRAIAGALDIRLKDLLQPVRRLDSVRFRKQNPKHITETIVNRFAELLKRT